jgi:hypothetical protein
VIKVTLVKMKLMKMLANTGYFTQTQKSKTIPITGHASLQGCEMLRIPHFLHNWLTEGGEVVSLMHQLHSTPQTHFIFLAFGKVHDLVWLEGLGKMQKFNDLPGS